MEDDNDDDNDGNGDAGTAMPTTAIMMMKIIIIIMIIMTKTTMMTGKTLFGHLHSIAASCPTSTGGSWVHCAAEVAGSEGGGLGSTGIVDDFKCMPAVRLEAFTSTPNVSSPPPPLLILQHSWSSHGHPRPCNTNG